MSPLEQKVQELEKRLAAIERAENVPFIESITRRLVGSFNIPRFLNDLVDVNAPSPTTGQVLEWNGTEWVPATDNVGP